MNINRENYEVYFLDYLDGALSKDLEKELYEFLNQNPDLKTEIDTYEKFNLLPFDIELPNKEKLKKYQTPSITENFEEYCIAYFEGDLKKEQEKILLDAIKNDKEKEITFNIFGHLKVKPDYSIHINNKSSLKRIDISLRRLIFRYAALIASVFFIGIFSYYLFLNYFHRNNNKPSDIQSQISTNLPIRENDYFTSNTTNVSYPVKKLNKSPDSIVNKYNAPHATDSLAAVEMNKMQFLPVKIEFRVPDSHLKPPLKFKHIQKSKTDDYLTLQKYLLTELNKKARNKLQIKDDKITAWNLLDLGLKEIKSVLGYNIDVKRKYDNTGNLAKIDIESEYFAFQKPLK